MTAPDDPSAGPDRRTLASVSGWDWDAAPAAPAAPRTASVAPGEPALVADDPGAPAADDGFTVPEAGRYEDGGLLGRGGMGEVRASLDRRLGRLVARKCVEVEPGLRDAATALLEREAQLTARLDHPGIVPVYDAGVGPDGRRYYTMRLITGGTLADAIAAAESLVARQRLLRSVLAAAQAVAFAHDRGVVHRDLKPQNILLGDLGETQVADWGLARDLGEPGSGHRVVGTPGFFAPEVRDGAAADRRSDVYSLGCVLREVLIGTGNGPVERAAGPRGSFEATPWPAELVAIVERATAASPDARYPDARALAADLEAFLDGRLVEAYRYSPIETVGRLARAWRAPLIVAGVGLCALALLGLLAWQRTREERDRAVLAEAETRDALQTADRNLAAAWLAAAEQRFAQGLWPEAEILAARALTRVESSSARGILSGALAATRVTRSAAFAMPTGCVEGQLGARADHLLCRHADAVSLWQVPVDPAAPLVQRWRQAVRCQSMALASDRVLLTVDREVHHHALADGALLRAEPAGVGGGGWQPQPSATTAIRIAGDILTVHRTGQGAVELATCATGTAMVAAVASDAAFADDRGATSRSAEAGDALVVCTDGAILGVDLSAARVVSQVQTELGPLHRGASAAWLGTDGAAFVGCHDGTLAALPSVTTAVPRWSRNAGVGQIHAIERRGDRLVVVGELGGPTIWDARTGALALRLPVSAGPSARLASATSVWTVGAQLQRWTLPSALRPASMHLGLRDDGLTTAAIAPDGPHVALANSVGLLSVFDLEDGAPLLESLDPGNLFKCVSWSADGRRLSAVGMKPDLLAFDAGHGFTRLPQRDLGPRRRIADVAGGLRVALDYGAGIEAVDATGASLGLLTVTAPSTPFLDVAMHRDGRLGCAVDILGGVWGLDARGLAIASQRIATFPGAEVCARTGDGATIVAARPGELLRLRVAPGGASAEPAPLLATGGERIHDVAFSHDGRWLALAELSGTVRVLAWPSGREVALLAGHRQRVASIAFSPDDTLLVSASWDGSARLWSVAPWDADAAILAREAAAAWPGLGTAVP